MDQFDQHAPAFPVPDAKETLAFGLTIRDYIATQALKGLLASDDGTVYEDQKLRHENYPAYCDNFAESAYLMADAMLKARGA